MVLLSMLGLCYNKTYDNENYDEECDDGDENGNEYINNDDNATSG